MQKELSELFTTHLSTEELALAFGLLGRGDLAGSLLAGLYENIEEEQARFVLAAAGHGLLARGLGQLSSQGDLQIGDDLQAAVYPLVEFDSLLQVGLVGAVPLELSVHLGNGQGFTAHITHNGVTHRLEHGPSAGLAGFLAGLAPGFGGEAGGEPMNVALQSVSLAQNLASDPPAARTALLQGGLDAAAADLLAADMAQQHLRGSLLRTLAGSHTPPEQVESAPRAALLLLQSPQRSWVFEFPGVDEDAQGTARPVTRETFVQILAAFTRQA